jgi:hypothetical protein
MKHRGKQVKDRGGGVNERRVFVTRPIAEPAIRRLAATARVDLWDDEMPPPPAELRARARGKLTACSAWSPIVSTPPLSARCRGFA